MVLLDYSLGDQFVADRHGIRDVERAVELDVSDFRLPKTELRAAKTMGNSRHLGPAGDLIRNPLEQIVHSN